ncbi:MAG: glycoside hydrolase family 127 protein, partial [Defluviitaleaceae bacterium]|nr:glycoside hydrolase family 127 protein [Defluviitaleaceae bacterium]
MKISDSFWTPIQDLMIDVVLPYQLDLLEDRVPEAEKSHAIQNFRIAAGEAEGEFYGMVFQDSDVAKWLEAVAYALTVKTDPELEKNADEIIALIGRAQEPDGYLNTFFSVKEPHHKWQNLLECHELYCSGHMIEAAVAYYEATGKGEFLNIMRRNADLICQRFGAGEGQVRGIAGHQEIELALYRLYKATNEPKYLETAKYFLDERGKSPSYFDEELASRDWSHWGVKSENREYAQNHLPVREQTQAVGHSVRAVYMYTAMAAIAAETGDVGLLNACRTLWANIVNKRMYITGGIGSTHHLESFTADYDLPNDSAYAETCASIAMVFFARKMLEIEPKGEYADIMERQLYNGVLSGMQMDGKRFFYVNPLEVVPDVSGVLPDYKHALPKRPEWFGCACCPPNMARLITSLGQYAWSENEKTIFSHLFINGTAEFKIAGGVQIDTQSDYPWENTIWYNVTPSTAEQFTLAIRIPAWCEKWDLRINTEVISAEIRDGYAYITRTWNAGDQVAITFSIEPQRIYANTKVRANANCVAIMRGPIVYCIEGCDNGEDLSALRLNDDSEFNLARYYRDDGMVTITAQGQRLKSNDKLYSTTPPESEDVTIRAVPYFTWGNRESGGMRVWIQT